MPGPLQNLRQYEYRQYVYLKFAVAFEKQSLERKIDTGMSCSFERGDLKATHTSRALPHGDHYLLNEYPLDDEHLLLYRAYILFRWIHRTVMDHQFA